MAFIKTAKQVEATDLMQQAIYSMLFGGSRSGKTFIYCRNLFLRAAKTKSRHAIFRLRFNHAKLSLWYDTIPKMLELCFPGMPVHENKSDWFYELPDNGSQIWIGGFDDKERVEKILGNEYSTIYGNECSQINYDTILTAKTRLAETSGLVNRFWFDCNPPSSKHWTYKVFIEHIDPLSGKKLDPAKYVSLLMNPTDNRDNLPEGYIDEILDGLPKRQRDRFLLGQFLTDIEGALWTQEMISTAQIADFGESIKTVVAIDPAVTNEKDSDETGIIVCSIDKEKRGRVEKDYTLKTSPDKWAQAAINAYHRHDANYIVAEVNQGGDMVKTIINQIDPNIKVKNVRASKGKFSRAEPVSALYERGLVSHAEGLELMESEMMEYVPETSKKSPNHLDAVVWGLTDLMLGRNKGIRIRSL